MDITGGKLVIDGDKTGTVGPYISSGWITAYGGAGTVQMDYNITTAGKTTVMSGAAVPLATTPNPADEAVNISTSAVLSWAPGVAQFRIMSTSAPLIRPHLSLIRLRLSITPAAWPLTRYTTGALMKSMR